ncbi:MAG: PBP1A family penicillin-binding protein [Alphaproteobacteria bacterium]|jgi:penicillin-binding protein 1A|nr:PBP1A family penicillin-binding protein [Alphaproteobacteria bacterium]
MLSALATLVSVCTALALNVLDLPDHRHLAHYTPPQTTRLYAADGSLVREYYVENRVFVSIESLPDYVPQAFISAEDQDFREHAGVDPSGLARAALVNVRNALTGRRLHGGSTITQQLAKNLLLTPEVSLLRKAREIVLALLIERDFGKDEILELYLNEIYLGRGSYGIGTAAQRYFGLPPSDLSLAQAAYLAALPKAPNNYHPVFRHDAAVARRNYVLDRMVEDGAITMAEAEAARAEALDVRRHAAPDTVSAPYFSEEVRRFVRSTLGSGLLYEGGLTVRTTVDPRLQDFAETALRDGLLAYDRRHGWRGPISNMERIVTRQQALEAAAAEAEAEAEAAAAAAEPAEEPAAAPAADSGGLFGRLSRLAGDRGAQDQAEAAPAEPQEAAPLWQTVLAEIDPPPGARDWRLAVVLEVAPRAARIGLADGEIGRIELGELSWARRWQSNDWVGPAVSRVADVLAVGDVILVESVDAVSAAVAAANDRQRRFGLRQVPRIQGAIVVLDPQSGRVLAMAGGYDYGLSEFNRATQAFRQPGSAFKPFVYLAALEQGYSPSTVLLDVPVEVEQGALARTWRPQNYGHDFAGALPLRAGVERSRNVMTVRLLLEMGLQPVADVADRFGIYDDMPLLPAMGLGAGETTLLRLTAAYGMIANGGFRIDPYLVDRIQDQDGRTIFRGDLRHCAGCEQARPETAPPAPDGLSERVTDPVTAYQMISILQGVVQRGTAARLASLGLPLAGKTGTTNEARDAWFVGFAPNLVAGVYVGFDEPRTLGRESGSSAAVPIFGAFMERALDNSPSDHFRPPSGITVAWINRHTGERVEPGSRGAILEVLRSGSDPDRPARQGPRDVFRATSDQSLQGTGGLY